MGVEDYLPILWYFSPSGTQTVNTVATDKFLYVGHKGRVFRLDRQKGDVQAEQGLKGYGFGDVSVAISEDRSLLLIATGGYLVSLHPMSLEIGWYKERVSNKGGPEPTSIVCGSDVVYAADSGWVYQLSAIDGAVLKKQNFGESAGRTQVNLALDKPSNRLYAGCNGYGICMDANTLETSYLTSLPGSGFNVTSVLAIGHSAVFGCKGRVFQLDTNGKVAARNDLSGYGNADTSLTFCGPDRLWACPDGYVAAMLMLVVP
ncbi:uncharacterized protein BKA55DRAFT_528582 [Fusarium redolens]|uniref:Uncharacterized protein n=1 Tax=Fusarium redolens TaxID=48865 RepID=A0A9P9JL14_FUSRE|nr:uncharacterized protein BKA55DRAFT_528582 [Fusarium redolens]KAH7216940.1 hypothetical protein BKA55DRAFT_528582 [Fusarium redolens]